MDSPFEGAVLDPEKCSKLSIEERREIVYELAKWSHGAAEMLQTWSRHDILQILCSEMGKERKYTGLTKLKIIEHLLKVVSEKMSRDQNTQVFEQQSSPFVAHKASKRPRKLDYPSRLPVFATNLSTPSNDSDLGNAIYCKNSACKARLSRGDMFCKRCSCCICRKYDDNKDPSLWLTCSSEPPFLGNSCNMSCHLECALKHESSGLARNGLVSQLDGSFYCVSCGKMNDLMRCWRKQVTIARDTRRVDILCYRISLSKKLLAGTNKYQELSEIVDDAVKLLETEVGTLTGIPVKMGRGIVNRLSSGQEVQRQCASAVESFDSMCSCLTLHQVNPLKTGDHVSATIQPPTMADLKTTVPSIIRVEDISATSVTVILGPDSLEDNIGYILWHCKGNDRKETAEPTCTLFPPQTRFIVSGLSPATEYIFKAISFDNTKELNSSEVRVTTRMPTGDATECLTSERIPSPATNCSTLSNPSSVEDETNNVPPCGDSHKNKVDNYFDHYKSGEKMVDPSSSSEPLGSTGASQDQNPSGGSNEEHGPHNGSNDSDKTGPSSLLPCVNRDITLPITPSRLEISKDGASTKGGPKSHNDEQYGVSGRVEAHHARSSSEKRTPEGQDEEGVGNAPSGGDLEYYIKVVRWLECEGHIDKSFRRKFLTWYGIRATQQETRIVKAFVDTLIDDPASLSEQLLDTFGEIVSSKRPSVPAPGFCLKLWH